jgi:hypothetical protein
MASNGPVELNAELRIGAANLYQIFIALMNGGFTEPQALTIIASMMIASSLGGGHDAT